MTRTENIKVALLAGGMGTRLQEETRSRPKPMVEIGGKPILWHIMKHFARHGLCEFYIALGYMGDFIKDYFLDAYNLNGHMRIDFAAKTVRREEVETEEWVVNLIETGVATLTGGRIHRLEKWLGGGTFMATYGDGVSDVDLTALAAFHRAHGRLATVTAVRPPARYGGLILEGDRVASFTEKPSAGEGWINGGFLVFEPEVFSYLRAGDCSLESEVLERLAADGELAAYRHHGFWQCMDTLREKQYLERLWERGEAPWATWLNPRQPTAAEEEAASILRFAARRSAA